MPGYIFEPSPGVRSRVVTVEPDGLVDADVTSTIPVLRVRAEYLGTVEP